MSLASLLLPIFLLAEEPVLDPRQEARAQTLMREIRCVACENEPISQSATPIAEDMRDRVRQLISNGASDDDVRDWFVDRYGEFVLFRPSGGGLGGFILWGAPFLIVALGAAAVAMSRRGGQAKAPEAVDPAALDESGPTAP